MKRFVALAQRLQILRDTRGQDLIEYALIAAFVWWLASMGYVSTDQRTLSWIVLVAIGVVLGVGMGWSKLRQRATGQVEVD